MEIESGSREVIRHGWLRDDGANPLIHLSQFDLDSVLTSVRGKKAKTQVTWTYPVWISLLLKLEKSCETNLN